MNELFEVDKQTRPAAIRGPDPDLIDDILTNAGKFCEEVLHPINQSGDEEGCHYENGVVRTPAGFKEAYKAYAEGGWGGLGAPEKFGGSNLPDDDDDGGGRDGAIRESGFRDVSGPYGPPIAR
jgi:alkylation response protein AidB-like acyl-CoA dehydrogenase